MKKGIYIALGIIGLLVSIIGGIVSNCMPNDYGRGDVVCAAVANCLTGIGAGFLVGDALFITHDVLEERWEPCWITSLLFIGGIIATLGSIPMGIFMTIIEIQDYDEYHGSEATSIEVCDASEDDLLTFQVDGFIFSYKDNFFIVEEKNKA